MKEIKNIDKISLAKITGLIYGLVGFIMAIIVVIASASMSNIVIRSSSRGSDILVILLDIGAGLLLGVITALLMALYGWLIGYLTAAIYNFFAGRVGGIKIELAEAGEKAQEKKEEGKENNQLPKNNNQTN